MLSSSCLPVSLLARHDTIASCNRISSPCHCPADALERGGDAKGRVTLHLPGGSLYRLDGTELRIHHLTHLSLQSEGTGATIDAQGLSRHFDCDRCPQLHLHRVRTQGGMTLCAPGVHSATIATGSGDAGHGAPCIDHSTHSHPTHDA